MTSEIKSESIIISPPLSFAGSSQRIWKITETNNALLKWLLFVPVALMFVMFAWMFVCFWYVIMYVVFGIFFIPFRLWRRGARKNKRNELRHREVLEAIERQKQ